MCCIRFNRCKKRRNDIVLDNSHIQRIALRGPGCINGTGQCEGVQGTGCICCGRVLGTGGICCGEVLGTGGRRCDNILGTGGRCRQDRCEWLWDDLTTPTTVPR
ncbi:MAG: hypothetical protein SA378_04160 [Sedimentibacter sp.]|uniref:hypothetical protein n=1 Tax=Sedimentibacter sp. TaxID=1960295 RepID=UPI002981AF66|nr:hypothetical protein [Sedimentibacter sp.]MDW5299317.1 hypothetical protein [Sedimentibacter sp.]